MPVVDFDDKRVVRELATARAVLRVDLERKYPLLRGSDDMHNALSRLGILRADFEQFGYTRHTTAAERQSMEERAFSVLESRNKEVSQLLSHPVVSAAVAKISQFEELFGKQDREAQSFTIRGRFGDLLYGGCDLESLVAFSEVLVKYLDAAPHVAYSAVDAAAYAMRSSSYSTLGGSDPTDLKRIAKALDDYFKATIKTKEGPVEGRIYEVAKWATGRFIYPPQPVINFNTGEVDVGDKGDWLRVAGAIASYHARLRQTRLEE